MFDIKEVKMPKIFIHADDFGNTINISKCIYKCFKDGSLNSTSIIVNSPYFEESIEFVKDEPIRKVLHLNIVEGKAVTNKNFNLLTDKNHHFYKSWQRLVFDYYCLFGKEKKAKIKKEIKEEYKNQILLYCLKMQTKEICIDSHQHTHEISFITDILIELINEMDINILNVRVTKEKFFWAIGSFGDLKNYIGINFFVYFLLNNLSNKMIKKFDRANIKYNDAFIGVLFSGDMTQKAIQKAFKKVENAKIVEILLHPGHLSDEEKPAFKNDQFKKFYISDNRKKEMRVLLCDKLKRIFPLNFA